MDDDAKASLVDWSLLDGLKSFYEHPSDFPLLPFP